LVYNTRAKRAGFVFNRTEDSLKKKFFRLANTKRPTGDASCPPYVRKAKEIMGLIEGDMHMGYLGETGEEDNGQSESEGESEGDESEEQQGGGFGDPETSHLHAALNSPQPLQRATASASASASSIPSRAAPSSKVTRKKPTPRRSRVDTVLERLAAVVAPPPQDPIGMQVMMMLNDMKRDL
jgi:hypothetical protein